MCVLYIVYISIQYVLVCGGARDARAEAGVCCVFLYYIYEYKIYPIYISTQYMLVYTEERAMRKRMLVCVCVCVLYIVYISIQRISIY